MMIRIGSIEFKYKKDALNYYKDILNSYDFGELLADNHFSDIISLLNYNTSEEDYIEDNDEYVIEDIQIGRAQFNTKCFELIYRNKETKFISYRLLITKPKENLFDDFRQAARNVTYSDVRNVKQRYFDKFSKKGFVPCQETNIQSKWTDLVIDHRQPNTFSVIVDRFIELKELNLKNIEYIVDENNFFIFKDISLIAEFRDYHKEKAVLRIVRKECNSGRAHQARIKEQKKDLKIK